MFRSQAPLWPSSSPFRSVPRRLPSTIPPLPSLGPARSRSGGGAAERWVLPACTLFPRTEITLGTAWFDRGADRRDGHLVAEAKVLGLDPEVHPWGWALEKALEGDHGHAHQGLLWGMRGDLILTDRLAILAEVIGLSGEGAEAQAGVRLHLVPDRFAVDLSYSRPPDEPADGLGFQVGVAWTPAPFRPPRP